MPAAAPPVAGIVFIPQSPLKLALPMKRTTTMAKSAVAALCAMFTHAAAAATEDDNRLWFNLNAQGPLPAANFGWYMELQPRWRDDAQEFDQMLIRPALFYKLTERGSLWFGYANVNTRRASGGSTEEHRLWQQFTYNLKLPTVSLQSRTRLEQRDLETGDDLGHRVRQLVRVTRPLAKTPKLSFVAWNELFINLNDTDWGARSGFDQNRLFLGMGYNFSAKVRAETGYLNQYVHTATVERQNHVLSTVLSLNF